MAKKKKLRIAIQGIATSFHEVAALTYFDEPIETVECLSFHQLCESLKNGKADYAVMAIENSIAGSILPNYFLLQEYHFSIVGELYLPIHMHLLASSRGEVEAILKPLNLTRWPFVSAPNICMHLKVLRSGKVMTRHFRQNECRELKLKNTAAIANEYAAKKFGLEILEKRIETHKKEFHPVSDFNETKQWQD